MSTTPSTATRPVQPLVVAVLLVGFVLTSAMVSAASAADRRVRQDIYERRSLALRDSIQAQVAASSEALLALRSAYAIDPDISAGQFDRFVRLLGITERTPGVLAFEHASAVAAAEVPAFTAAVRSDPSVPAEQGALFAVNDPGGDPVRVIVDAISPFAANDKAYGLDLTATPDRRAALVAARDTGELFATKAIGLGENPAKLGFLLMAAIYNGGEIPATEPARRRHFAGAALAVFDVKAMFIGLKRAAGDLEVELYDVGATVDPASTTLDTDTLLFNKSAGLTAKSPPSSQPAGSVDLDVGGRRWRLYTEATPGLPGGSPLLPFSAGLGGALVSLLGAAWAASVVGGRQSRSDATFRSFLEFAPDAVVIIDAQGNIVQVNARCEALFGHERRDLIGRSVEQLLPPAVRHEHVAHRLDYVAAPEARAMGAGRELQGMRSDGAVFAVDVSLSVLQTETGPLYAAAVRDVTERRQAEKASELARQRLHEADQLKSEFLDMTAHELRTPLTAIDGFTEVLRTDAEHLDDDQRGRLIDRIAVNVTEMRDMVERLLDLSQLSAGRVTLHPRRVVVAEEAAAVVERLAARLRGHPLMLDVAPDLAAWADPRAFRHVLVNLLTNAAKFSPERGQITVRAFRRGQYVEVRVADRGPGIAEDDQARLFDDFVQVGEHGPGQRGTGVGLSIVRRYVELVGGEVGVDSRVSEGSTFWFTLPLRPVDGGR